MKAGTRTRSELQELVQLGDRKRELEKQLALLNDKLAEIAGAPSQPVEKAFMRLAGSIEGAPDLSLRRAFDAA